MRERVTFSCRGTREDGDAGDATKESSSSSNTSFIGECVTRGVDVRLLVRGRGTSAHGGAKDGAVRAAAD